MNSSDEGACKDTCDKLTYSTGTSSLKPVCRCKRGHDMAAETSLLNTGRFDPSISYTPRPANFTRWWRCRGWTCCRQRPCHHTFDQSVQHLRNRPQSTNSPASRNKQCQVAAHATLQGGLVEPRSGGARELLTWISELPWARVAIWATVVVTASQFQDFFGVHSLLRCLYNAVNKKSHTRLVENMHCTAGCMYTCAATCGWLSLYPFPGQIMPASLLSTVPILTIKHKIHLTRGCELFHCTC